MLQKSGPILFAMLRAAAENREPGGGEIRFCRRKMIEKGHDEAAENSKNCFRRLFGFSISSFRFWRRGRCGGPLPVVNTGIKQKSTDGLCYDKK